MTLEPDRYDYCVQYTDTTGGEWKSANVFEDPFSAKRHADHLLHGTKVASVREDNDQP